jgi:hypothetical protein
MTTDNLMMTKIDPDAETRRALAKVYIFLIHLAEEAEKKTDKSTLTQTNALDIEVSSLNLQQNIPP